jgi:hypothetical protein
MIKTTNNKSWKKGKKGIKLEEMTSNNTWKKEEDQ